MSFDFCGMNPSVYIHSLARELFGRYQNHHAQCMVRSGEMGGRGPEMGIDVLPEFAFKKDMIKMLDY